MKGRTTSGGAWYAAAAPGGGGGGLAMDLRNGRLLMLCFVFVSTLLMLASTTVLQPKPDTSNVGRLRKPLPAGTTKFNALQLVSELELMSELEHAAMDTDAAAELESTAGDTDAAALQQQQQEALPPPQRPDDDDDADAVVVVVQDAVSFQDEVLLTVGAATTTSSSSSSGTSLQRLDLNTECHFEFYAAAGADLLVSRTPVTSVARKHFGGSGGQAGQLLYVRCAHPPWSATAVGGSNDTTADGGRSSPWGRVTLALLQQPKKPATGSSSSPGGGGRRRRLLPSRARYRPLPLGPPSWEEPLVYEATAQADGVVLMAKNLRNRGSNKYFDVSDLACVFLCRGHGEGQGDAGAALVVAHSTRALVGAQEVVHCEWPDPGARRGLVGCKVTLAGARYGGLLPSVAYFHPHPDFLVVSDDNDADDPAAAAATTTTTTNDPAAAAAGSGLGPDEHTFRHHLCACTMVWNKAKFLTEWAVYHAHLGVQRFFVYDNNSDDDLDAVLAALNARGSGGNDGGRCDNGGGAGSRFSVASQQWPWLKTQQAAFSHCAVRARQEDCKWVMFLDVDEFVHPVSYMAPPKRASSSSAASGSTRSSRLSSSASKKKTTKKAKVGKKATSTSTSASGRTLQVQEDDDDDDDDDDTAAAGGRDDARSSRLPDGDHADGECDGPLPLLTRLIEDVATSRRPIYASSGSQDSAAAGDSWSSLTSSASRPPAIGEIRLDCHNFGPSGLTRHPAQGVVVGYTCREAAPKRHKSLVRAAAISAGLLNLLHHFELRPGFQSVTVARKYAVVNHYKFQVWEDFKLKFVRRAGTFTTDWTSKQNVASNDRTPGLATEPVMPDDWHTRFCQVRDTALAKYVKRTFTTAASNKLVWQQQA